jgi:hypothetical protein
MMHTWKVGAKGLVLLTLSVLVSTDMQAQSKLSQDSAILNPKKAPAILELSAEKEQVRNASSKTIVRFTLGCVTPIKRKLTMIDMVLAENNSNVAPGQTITDIAEDTDFSQPLTEVCASRHSKLAVVDVLFSNGKRWTILKTRWRVIPVLIFVAFRQDRITSDG